MYKLIWVNSQRNLTKCRERGGGWGRNWKGRRLTTTTRTTTTTIIIITIIINNNNDDACTTANKVVDVVVNVFGGI